MSEPVPQKHPEESSGTSYKVAGGIGETITVNLPTRSISGRFLGIDDTGLLKLQTDDGGVRLIAAGDVFFE